MLKVSKPKSSWEKDNVFEVVKMKDKSFVHDRFGILHLQTRYSHIIDLNFEFYQIILFSTYLVQKLLLQDLLVVNINV